MNTDAELSRSFWRPLRFIMSFHELPSFCDEGAEKEDVLIPFVNYV